MSDEYTTDEYTTDCGDGSCILRDRSKPSGQRTNGGCRERAALERVMNDDILHERARADAAEAKCASLNAPFHGGALRHIEALHADQRASRDREEALAMRLDVAEEKLAALVEALDAERAFVRTPRVAWSIVTDSRLDGLEEATDAALRAARGEP